MIHLPLSFDCSVKCPNGESYSIKLYSVDSGNEMKKRINSETGYSKEEMTLFFNSLKIHDHMLFQDLEPEKFPQSSQIIVCLENPFSVIVRCSNKKQCTVLVSSHTSFTVVSCSVSRTTGILQELLELNYNEKEVNLSRIIVCNGWG
jgi:hypothetical protein